MTPSEVRPALMENMQKSFVQSRVEKCYCLVIPLVADSRVGGAAAG